MNNIEQKALEMISAARKEHPTPDNYLIARTALCRAIERHEAFRQEVSDAVELSIDRSGHDGLRAGHINEYLGRFIISKPKPDPLAQTLGDFDGTLWEPEDVLRFRAALEARGLTITTLEKD